jgi:hypothetical protein
MRLVLLTGTLVGGLLFATSSCSGKSELAEFTDVAGRGSGGSAAAGAAAQGGTKASGGSSAGNAGGSSAGNAGGSSAGNAGGTGAGNAGGSSAGEAGASSAGEASTSGGTSNHGQPDCDEDFNVLDRSCETPDDCALVGHQVDCCGTILVMGLSSTEQPAFSALEQYCSARFPLCDCAPRGKLLEDGTLVGAAAITVADCIDGRCRSRSNQAARACGDQSCNATQYCHERTGGPVGSEPSYDCLPLGDCHDCGCLSMTGCQCTQTAAGIKVFCAAP